MILLCKKNTGKTQITQWIIPLFQLIILIDIDDCPGNTCVSVHLHACEDGINSYTCRCLQGYNGTNCENGENIRLI